MTDGSCRGLVKGIGDDCSVFGNSASGSWLVSTDMLVEHVHFERNLHPAKLLGRKSIAVNLSDIAAMGGIPRFALIAISIPADLSSKWLFSWFDGAHEILREHDCCLIGGDTVGGKEMNISVTIIGEQHPSGILYRKGAEVDDTVYVSAPLGFSAAGLALLLHSMRSGKSIDQKWNPLINAHLDPHPRIELGQVLCASGYVSAMQDISDGLATDLGHICKESKVGAVIYERLLPGGSVLEEASLALGISPIDCMLCGGEDYQLVFTVRKDFVDKFENYLEEQGTFDIVALGQIVEEQGIILEEEGGRRREISFQGYEHIR